MCLHTKGHKAISDFNKALNYKECSKLSQQYTGHVMERLNVKSSVQHNNKIKFL